MSRSIFRLGAGQGQRTGMFLAGCKKRFTTSRIEEKNQGLTPTRIEIGVTIARPGASRVTCQASRMRTCGAVVPPCNALRWRSRTSKKCTIGGRLNATAGLGTAEWSFANRGPYHPSVLTAPHTALQFAGTFGGSLWLALVEVFPYGGSASPTPSGITSGTILVLQPLGYFVA